MALQKLHQQLQSEGMKLGLLAQHSAGLQLSRRWNLLEKQRKELREGGRSCGTLPQTLTRRRLGRFGRKWMSEKARVSSREVYREPPD